MQYMSFQVVGYTGDHWINRQVSFWSGSAINHVAIRFFSEGTDPVEYYYDVKKGPQLVRSASVEKFYNPVRYSPMYRCSEEQWDCAGDIAMAYPVGKVLPCYRHFFVGGNAPPTCARMVSDQLACLGMPVDENFMPGKLIEEFIERYN